MFKMAIKTYLISCFIILANCNVHATNVADDCEESEVANGGYFASGSAHSSQYVLPSGELVTHSKGSSYSSGGIKETFENLKHEANQFVHKQKDTINIPNSLPPLHTGLDQDLQHISEFQNINYNPSQSILNKFESASQQKQKEIYNSEGQNGQVYYPYVPQQGSKISSTKKEQFQVSKKVVTHGLPAVYPNVNEEIEVGQNGVESVNTGSKVHYIPISRPSESSFHNVHQSSGANHEIETLGVNSKVPVVSTQKIQAIPLSSQYSQYENSVKKNSASQVIPGIPTYIPTGTFTTGLIDFTSNDGQNVQISNLKPFITSQVPSRQVLNKEQHYNKEEESTNYNENTVLNSEQKEHKYNAIPVVKTPELPIKIKYIYDGKNLQKTEEYSSGLIKPVPISVEEYENTLREIHRQEAQSETSQSYGAQPTVNVKPEPEGYYYPVKGQSVGPSNVQTFKKEESQSSHSHQTITSGDSSGTSNVEQFSHLPLNVNSQKQYSNAGYVGVIAPSSASQISEEQLKQAQIYATNPAILVGGVPQLIPIQNQHSSSSGSTFQSSSHFTGSNGDFVFPDPFINQGSDLHSSDSSAFGKLSSSSLNQNSGLLTSGAKVPLKSSYGIATSFSSSSSNINGKKNENRQASVTVNDNGKVDTYNVKS